MCFTWPALEAAATEGEPPGRLQSMVGLYNATWSITSALAYFSGGAIFQRWGLKSLFYCPAALMLLQLALAQWLDKEAARQPPAPQANRPVLRTMAESAGAKVSPRTFLRMAWLANPFAYLTVNTIVATIPSLAKHRDLSPALAGFVCSLWLFARAGAFIALRLWPKWHYRFDFLAGAYGALVLSFSAILLARSLWLISAAQIILGLALGLIYYSSLFYSMDLGETKGEHGGIHEAVIGLGNGTGPAVAAIALALLPSHPASGAMAVSALLLVGLAALFWIRFRNSGSTYN
jgi:predicted MFS family arabinose efflux permease